MIEHLDFDTQDDRIDVYLIADRRTDHECKYFDTDMKENSIERKILNNSVFDED